MTFFSFKSLALGWTAFAGAAAIGAGALQASYVPPAPPPAQPAPIAAETPAVAHPPAMPFENRSLQAIMPAASELRTKPTAPRAAAAAEPLPIPPVPPAPARSYARAEPHRVAPARSYAVEEPRYAQEYPPSWMRRMPYPGQYVDSRAYWYGAQPSYYGWQSPY
jgi:hypothetical protein